jgi:hypothetical protein
MKEQLELFSKAEMGSLIIKGFSSIEDFKKKLIPIECIDYFRTRLYAASKIPPRYFQD